MILIDTNLLVYAINNDAPYHSEARLWLKRTFSSTTWVGLPWICLLGFIRVTTHKSVLSNPLQVEAALKHVNAWLNQPFVEPVGPGKGHWHILQNLLRSSGAAGNLTTDAHIAAMALERGATVYSADHDFKRFPGVEHVNPLEGPPNSV